MASLQERNGSFRVQFVHHGKPLGFTISPDITGRNNPVVVPTEVTTAAFPENQGGGLPYPKVVPVGGGEFAVSSVIVDGDAAILLVDASDPSNIRTAGLHVGNNAVDEIAVAGGNLYATGDGVGVGARRAGPELQHRPRPDRR